MVEFKLVVADGAKSYARTAPDAQAAGFLGKRLGESIGGELLGLSGYTLKIAGATDKSGFPLRPDLPGARQTRLLVGEGLGYHPERHGARDRRTFRGNTISEDTVQINLVVTGRGPTSLAELLAPAAAPAKS
jgi:small subunit ribosomal protein S6e